MIIKILNKTDLTVPKRANSDDLGYDIVATSEPNIVGEKVKLFIAGVEAYKYIDYIEYDTNLQIAPQKDINWRGVERKFHTLAFPRSSISKYNLVLKNSIGLIDNGFRNNVRLRFAYLFQPQDFVIESGQLWGKLDPNKIYKKGDKISQLVPHKNIDINFEIVDTLDETSRNMDGFGSSGQ